MGDVQRRVYVPATAADDWKRHLDDPGKQWQPGQSSYALAQAWQGSEGFPPAVKAAFAGSGALFETMELLAAIPEYQTSLPARGRGSQLDLFVVARTRRVLAAMAVEAKVEEAFGPTVGAWRRAKPSPGKEERLALLCQVLEIDERDAEGCPYQLLHRTAAALLEARRFNAQHAVMLVHSFSAGDEGFEAFARFADVLGTEARLGDIAPTRPRDGILLHLGWASDPPP
jgi:hypothetical protein